MDFDGKADTTDHATSVKDKQVLINIEQLEHFQHIINDTNDVSGLWGL